MALVETRKQRLRRLEAELATKTKLAADYLDLLVFQGSLLSDAYDIFEDVGLGDEWHKFISLSIAGGVDEALPIWRNAKAHRAAAQSTAQERLEHGTITAQSGLPVHEPAY